MTVHSGMRWSAASAYLHPALARPNLHTLTGVLVTRVILEATQTSSWLQFCFTKIQAVCCLPQGSLQCLWWQGGRAVGVEMVHSGQVKQIRAESVILCGGAVNSPQLLQLSGVGDADQGPNNNIVGWGDPSRVCNERCIV